MKCEKAQELFSEHLEGAMERPMVIAFERHLAECPECDREYTTFRMTWQMLESLPEVAPPPGFAASVTMKVREQREAELAARSWWKRTLSDVFASGVPVKAFAAAAAAIILGTTLLTPIGNYIGASFGLHRSGDHSAVKSTGTVDPGQVWLDSGLSFELDSASWKGGWSVFRLLLKPKETSEQNVSVYLMEPGKPRFDSEGVGKGRLIFDGEVTDSGQVIPFVLGQSGETGGVMTALIRWEHKKRQFAEAVFVPMKVSPGHAPAKGSVDIQDIEIYSALQEISSEFGAVILVNADINQMVSGVSVRNGSVEDALYQVSRNSGLRYRPLGAQVYMVERKIK